MKIAIALVMSTLGEATWAWGSDGHQLVARIAQAQLTPNAHNGVWQ